MNQLAAQLARLTFVVPLVLRVVLGSLFAYHGFKKFQGGVDDVEGFFDSVGVPAPEIFAPLVAGLEVALGVTLVIGLATRLSALVLSGVMVGAIFYVKLDLGVISPAGEMPGSELDLALLAGLLSLAILGPGRPSVDDGLGLERRDHQLVPGRPTTT